MAPTSAHDLARVARWFHALADETRLQIVERLASGEHCVCDLTDLLRTSQSRLSFHLKTLKDAGILIDRREGRWIYYSLNQDVLDDLAEAIRAMKPTQGRGQTGSSPCCG